MNVGEPNNSNLNYELIKRKEIENTPFTIVTIEEKEHFVTIGKYRLSENYNTLEEAEATIKTINWNTIMQVIAVMIENYKTTKE